MNRKQNLLIIIVSLCLLLGSWGCGKDGPSETVPGTAGPTKEEESSAGSRDSTPRVLVPEASGVTVYENDLAAIDASNLSEGYVMARYKGTVSKVKLQIQTPSGVTYTYTMRDGYEAFPLTDGDGSYKVTVWEQRPATGDYLNILSQTVEAVIDNEFSPYLYPNQYVNFTPDCETVALGERLSEGAADDLDVVARIYDYVTEHISYDYDKAETVQSGYVPDVDQVLEAGQGICFDYAAVMATMLRSQRIPTRMEIGYAGEVYHAWISTHIEELGWVNGIIEFDGSRWKLMDPTFAANSSEKDLKDFIGDGGNYQTKYVY